MKRQILDDVFSEKPNGLLYHYTAQGGLLGILEKREIWATHTGYLNDTREYAHALDLAQQEVAGLIVAAADDQKRAILKSFQTDLTRPDGSVRSADGNICVASFSEDGDSLSQWRAYAPSGGGFSIGFDGTELQGLAERNEFRLARCIYEEQRQRELIRNLIEEVVDENAARRSAICSVEDPNFERMLLERGGNWHFYLHRFAPILKDTAFRDEQEWRLVSGPLSCALERFEFREGKSMLVPYYRFPLEHPPIKEVVIGPTMSPESSLRSLRSFLVRKGVSPDAARLSNVPYRHW